MVEKIYNKKFKKYLLKHILLSLFGLFLYFIIGNYATNNFSSFNKIGSLLWGFGLLIIFPVLIGYFLTYPMYIIFKKKKFIIKSLLQSKEIYPESITQITYGSLKDIDIHYDNKTFNGVLIDKDIQRIIIHNYNLYSLIVENK